MSPVRVFHRYRGLSTLTLPDLVRIAARLLPQLVRRQPRYKVTPLPSERTVRFYLSRRLIDRPLGREGTTALFGYRHLLQLLAVKYLQSQYLPLRKVQTILEGRTNREIERLLPEGPSEQRLPAQVMLSEGDGGEAEGVPEESGGGSESWIRLYLRPGVELHLREEFAPPPGEEGRRWKLELNRLFSALQARRERRRDD